MSSSELVLKVIGKSLEKFAGEAFKSGSVAAVITAVLGPVGAPMLGAFLPAMISVGFDAITTSSALKKKLDALNENPFNAAHDMFEAVMRARWKTEDQRAERARLLKIVSDKLYDAAAIAKQVRPDLLAAIQLLQAITYALRPEAGPLFEKALETYRGIAARDRLEALEAIEKAKFDQKTYAAVSAAYLNPHDPFNNPAILGYFKSLEELSGTAKHLNDQAAELEAFCDILRSIGENRDIVLDNLGVAIADLAQSAGTLRALSDKSG
jgi:hypothetical protein